MVVYFKLTHIYHEPLSAVPIGRTIHELGKLRCAQHFSSTPAPTMGPQDIRGPYFELRYVKLELRALIVYLRALSSFCFLFGRRGAGIRRLTGRQKIQGNQY